MRPKPAQRCPNSIGLVKKQPLVCLSDVKISPQRSFVKFPLSIAYLSPAFLETLEKCILMRIRYPCWPKAADVSALIFRFWWLESFFPCLLQISCLGTPTLRISRLVDSVG